MTSRSTEASWASPHKGKFSRQLAILNAAREIITELGEAGLTMRTVAARAGVSLATPYNLFGSKQAVLLAILEEDFSEFSEAFERRASKDAFVRLFDLIDLSIEHYKRSPEFYKPILSFLYVNMGSPVGMKAWEPQIAHVRTLVADAVRAGDLREQTPVALVSATLTRVFRATAQEWVGGLLTLDEARNELGAALGLLLTSLVAEPAQGKFARVRERYLVRDAWEGGALAAPTEELKR
jgi:AcrR family transcriptional regulator